MNKDRFGFLFWLAWMAWFATSFLIAALVWTAVIHFIFGGIEGSELTFTWCTAVFGSWFMLMIPFMRKKEQIWKRVNVDQERSINLWLVGMGAFLSAAIFAAVGWSYYYRFQFIGEGLYAPWSRAVFGTWLFLLLPLMVFMYRQADRIFRDAVTRQSQTGPVFRTVLVEKSKRVLPNGLVKKIQQRRPVLEDGYVVSFLLKDGRKIHNVFVTKGNEILGVYDRVHIDFSAEDIQEVQVLDKEELPVYEEEKWLRLDGRA